MISNGFYPLVNKLVDPENHQSLMETSLPTPTTARVYVNLPEGISSGFFDQGYGIVRAMDRDLIFPYFPLVKPG